MDGDHLIGLGERAAAAVSFVGVLEVTPTGGFEFSLHLLVVREDDWLRCEVDRQHPTASSPRRNTARLVQANSRIGVDSARRGETLSTRPP